MNATYGKTFSKKLLSSKGNIDAIKLLMEESGGLMDAGKEHACVTIS